MKIFIKLNFMIVLFCSFSLYAKDIPTDADTSLTCRTFAEQQILYSPFKGSKIKGEIPELNFKKDEKTALTSHWDKDKGAWSLTRVDAYMADSFDDTIIGENENVHYAFEIKGSDCVLKSISVAFNQNENGKVKKVQRTLTDSDCTTILPEYQRIVTLRLALDKQNKNILRLQTSNEALFYGKICADAERYFFTTVSGYSAPNGPLNLKPNGATQ